MVLSPPRHRIPLHHWHAGRGARFTDQGGWHLPAVYSTTERETAAARTGLALADISAFAKLGLLGPGVPALAHALTGDGRAAKPRAVAALDAGGRLLACRLTDDQLLLLASTTDPGVFDRRLADLPADPTVVRSEETSAQAGFCLVGFSIEKLLRRLTSLDVAPGALPPGSCAETGLAGVPALLVRPPESEPPSLRVHVGWDVAEYVWERVLDAGRSQEIMPVGLEALRSLGLADS
jgi:glycine cleavage system aminomethyltransferase T